MFVWFIMVYLGLEGALRVYIFAAGLQRILFALQLLVIFIEFIAFVAVLSHRHLRTVHGVRQGLRLECALLHLEIFPLFPHSFHLDIFGHLMEDKQFCMGNDPIFRERELELRILADEFVCLLQHHVPMVLCHGFALRVDGGFETENFTSLLVSVGSLGV